MSFHPTHHFRSHLCRWRESKYGSRSYSIPIRRFAKSKMKMIVITPLSLLLVISTLVSTTHSFSITMSSYLDQLARQAPAVSSSYSYGASATAASTPSYAPTPAAPSYSYAPAPAPAKPAYVSAFANMPANNDLHYLKTLGGGSAKKWGADYTGVSSTFRPTKSIGHSAYLDNLKGMIFSYSAVAAPPPAPAYSYASSWATPAAAAAPAASASYSYGGSSSSPSPAPYVSSFAPASSSAPKSTSSYLSSL
jgi:hypothetical protein